MESLRIRTKKVFNLTFQLIIGNFPENDDRIRHDNINFLFVHTIQRYNVCMDAYDKAYKLYTNHDKAKAHAFELLTL